MIQRIQTLFLFLAAVCAGVNFNISPIFSGVIALAALVAIFLYKRRRWQMTLAIFGILLCIATAVLYPVTPTFVTSAGAILFFILACIFIHKDEKLIKSLDRIR